MAVLAVGGSNSAGAATLTHTGSWDGTGPTMPVVLISTPDCTIQGTTPVQYEVIPYTPLVSGDVSFTITVPTGASTSLYVMEHGFDPSAAYPYCLAGTNTRALTYGMTAGTEYDLVVFNDLMKQTDHSWELTIVTQPYVDMVIGITDGGSHQPGDTVRFTVTTTNAEGDDAANSKVVATLPAGFDPNTIGNVTVGGTPAYNCIVDTGTRTLTCTATLHPAGETATIAFDATLMSNLANGDELKVDAKVTVESPTTVNTDDDQASTVVVVNIPSTTSTSAPTTSTTSPATSTTVMTPATGAVVTPTFTG